VRFGSLGEFGSGSTPSRGEDKYYGNGINWFKSGELTDSYMLSDSEEQIKQLALKECSLRINKPGDILVAMYGATAGKLGLLEVEGTTNQAVCGITLFEGVTRLFAFRWLLATRNILIGHSSGAAQPNISKIKIVNHVFGLPPTSEQDRIVEKVDAIFKLIDELAEKFQAEQAMREKLVASSLAYLARGNSKVALSNLAEIIRTKSDATVLRKTILHLAISGRISSHSDEWLDTTLTELVDLKTGRLDANAAVEGGQYPFFTCSHSILEIDHFAYDTECVLLAGNGDFNIKYYKGKFEAYQRTYILEAKDRTSLHIPYLFIVMQIRSKELLGEAMGSAMPYIRKANVLATKVKLPSLEEQIRIVKKTTQLLDLVTELEKHLAA